MDATQAGCESTQGVRKSRFDSIRLEVFPEAKQRIEYSVKAMTIWLLIAGKWSVELYPAPRHGIGHPVVLAVHVVDTSAVFFFPPLYADAIAIYRSVSFMIGEIFLVCSVISWRQRRQDCRFRSVSGG